MPGAGVLRAAGLDDVGQLVIMNDRLFALFYGVVIRRLANPFFAVDVDSPDVVVAHLDLPAAVVAFKAPFQDKISKFSSRCTYYRKSRKRVLSRICAPFHPSLRVRGVCSQHIAELWSHCLLRLATVLLLSTAEPAQLYDVAPVQEVARLGPLRRGREEEAWSEVRATRAGGHESARVGAHRRCRVQSERRPASAAAGHPGASAGEIIAYSLTAHARRTRVRAHKGASAARHSGGQWSGVARTSSMKYTSSSSSWLGCCAFPANSTDPTMMRFSKTVPRAFCSWRFCSWNTYLTVACTRTPSSYVRGSTGRHAAIVGTARGSQPV